MVVQVWKTIQQRNLRPFVWAAASSGLAFLLLSALVVSGVSRPFDVWVLETIHATVSPLLTQSLAFLANFGEPIYVGIVAVFVGAMLVYRQQRTKAALVVCGVLGASVANILIKTLVERPRPELWTKIVFETGYSFPSGHATASVALALCVVALLWRTSARRVSVAIAAAYVIIIGFSRLCLGVHYPTDIFAGWLLAICWAATTILVICLVKDHLTKDT